MSVKSVLFLAVPVLLVMTGVAGIRVAPKSYKVARANTTDGVKTTNTTGHNYTKPAASPGRTGRGGRTSGALGTMMAALLNRTEFNSSSFSGSFANATEFNLTARLNGTQVVGFFNGTQINMTAAINGTMMAALLNRTEFNSSSFSGSFANATEFNLTARLNGTQVVAFFNGTQINMTAAINGTRPVGLRHK